MARSRPATAEDRARAFWEGVAFSARFFSGIDEVHQALEKLAATLDADGIPYAIAGGMALNAHGYRRVTVDVDVLLTAESLAKFKERHLGRGWVERSKGVRDTEFNVNIDVLLTGDYPGDGLPKPVRFPDPAVAERAGEVRVLPVRTLVELKLASGLSNPDRLKDLADVQELIRHAGLPLELANELDASVRAKYVEIWHGTRRRDDDED